MINFIDIYYLIGGKFFLYNLYISKNKRKIKYLVIFNVFLFFIISKNKKHR